MKICQDITKPEEKPIHFIRFCMNIKNTSGLKLYFRNHLTTWTKKLFVLSFWYYPGTFCAILFHTKGTIFRSSFTSLKSILNIIKSCINFFHLSVYFGWCKLLHSHAASYSGFANWQLILHYYCYNGYDV